MEYTTATDYRLIAPSDWIAKFISAVEVSYRVAKSQKVNKNEIEINNQLKNAIPAAAAYLPQ